MQIFPKAQWLHTNVELENLCNYLLPQTYRINATINSSKPFKKEWTQVGTTINNNPKQGLEIPFSYDQICFL